VLSGPFPGPLSGLMMATVSTELAPAATVSHVEPGYVYKGTNNLMVPEQPVVEDPDAVPEAALVVVVLGALVDVLGALVEVPLGALVDVGAFVEVAALVEGDEVCLPGAAVEVCLGAAVEVE